MSDSKIEHKKNGRENSFSDFIIVLVKWRKIILFNVIIITLLSTIISFLLPKWYTSTANIIPPKSKGGLLGDLSNFSSTIKDISKTLGRLGTTSDQAYNYLQILESRRSYEAVINKFNIRSVYKFDIDDPIEDVIRELSSNVDFKVEDEGNITVKVSDRDPKRAADMANYFVELLNSISIELGTFEAKNNREFIETRYFQLLRDIKSAEDSLKIFSEKYSVFSLTDQTKAAITAAAELKATVEMQKIELDLMVKNYGVNSPQVSDKKLIINEIEKRLNSMNFSDANLTNDKVKLFTEFSRLPDIGMKYLRYRREFELQTKLLEFILPIYEQAKIEEKKNIPVCLILDNAVPAQKKSSPKRVVIVIASFFVSFFFSILWVLLRESLERLRLDQERFNKINMGIFLPLKKLFFLR